MPITAIQHDTPTQPKYAWEKITFCADFSREPEILAGATISTADVPAVSGLTIASVQVNAVAFDGIPIGKGVQATISTGTAGTTYEVEFRATLSDGSQKAKRLKIVVE